MVIAHLLTPVDMGIYAIALATISVLAIVSAFGVGVYVVRATELGSATLASAFTVNAILAVAMAVVIYLASVAERTYFGNLPVAQVLAPLALGPLIGIFEFRPSTMLQREMNFRLLALINTANIVVSTTTTIAMALNGYAFMSLVYGNLAASVFGAACVNLAASQHVGFALSLAEGRQIAVFGVRMMSIGGVATLAQRLSDIILGNLLGLAALGLYSRASNISNLIFTNVYGAVTRVLFVQLSTDFRERGVLRDVFLRGFEMITALLWPILIGLAVLSSPAIYILYGAKWLGAALPLSLLMIAQFVVLCFGMNWELFVLRDETARQAKFEAVRAVVGVMVFTLGCMFSISAAAVGRIAEAVFGWALYHPHMNRMAGTSPGELARIYANGFVLTVAAVLPSFLLMMATNWSHLTSPGLIAAAIAAGILLWLAVLIWQKHPLLAEIELIAGRFGLAWPAWAHASRRS